MYEFSRTALVIGKTALEKLRNSTVAVFGIGGVGSFVAEALARSGIGKLFLVDNDVVSITNLNRQLIALHSTVGRPKVEIMRERILDIYPACKVECLQSFYTEENKESLPFTQLDYIVDAIDTVSSKLLLIEQAKRYQVPIISCMGTGNKLDPTKFEVTDITKTSVCPLARVMRRELKKRRIDHVKVVYSKEEAIKPDVSAVKEQIEKEVISQRRQIPGSTAFVPPVAGMIAASEVVKDLILKDK